MTETRTVSSGSASRAALEDERRRAAESASSKGPSSADAARSTVPHREIVYLPAYGADLQAFIANASKETRVPPSFGDLTLYTDDALEREIDSTRGRVAKRPGPEGDGDRLALDRLEGEVIRRHTPPLVDANALKTRGEVEQALKAEADFLGTYGARIQPSLLRGQHQQALGDLERRHQSMIAEATACDNAKPVVVPTLGDGASRKQVTADMIVATLKQRITLTPPDEAGVRATFERWRSDVCRTTGEDPTTTVASNRYREAHVDTEARDREMLQMRLDMLNAAATSACAALAFLDSSARGDSLAGAHRRVMLASTLSDVALTMPSRRAPPKVESQETKSTEVQGLAQRITNEAQGAGHAQTTRFRGVDNSQFAKGGTVTYGPYRKNVGPPRSVDQVVSIYEKVTGRKMPSYVKVVVDASNPPDEGAKYVLKRSGTAERPFELEQLTDGVVVRIRPEILESDEAIVGTMRHEAHEIENLERLLSEGNLTNADVTSHIKAGNGQNLHGQAWDVADLEVLIMRERPGSSRHTELVARQKAMLANMDLQNHGSSE